MTLASTCRGKKEFAWMDSDDEASGSDEEEQEEAPPKEERKQSNRLALLHWSGPPVDPAFEIFKE